MKIQYWAVGLNFDYDIVTNEPDLTEWGSVVGPFDNLKDAKKQVKYWIKNDKNHLSTQLYDIMNLKVKNFKNKI